MKFYFEKICMAVCMNVSLISTSFCMMQSLLTGIPSAAGLVMIGKGFKSLKAESERQCPIKDFEKIYTRLKSRKEDDSCILKSVSDYMTKYHPSIKPFKEPKPEDAACKAFYTKWGKISPVFLLEKLDAESKLARSEQSELIFADYLEDLKKGSKTTAGNKKKGLLLSGIGASLLIVQSIEWYLGYYK